MKNIIKKTANKNMNAQDYINKLYELKTLGQQLMDYYNDIEGAEGLYDEMDLMEMHIDCAIRTLEEEWQALTW
jgi:hypothetical protein